MQKIFNKNKLNENIITYCDDCGEYISGSVYFNDSSQKEYCSFCVDEPTHFMGTQEEIEEYLSNYRKVL